MSKNPLVLMILDGWGERRSTSDNAITNAHPVNFHNLRRKYPHTLLKCSGLDVGLPRGQMGNSEVGHLNIGSGRVVYQEITRISQAIKDESFFCNLPLIQAINQAQSNNKSLHLMGLLSDGGVHSHLEHLYALLELCHRQGMNSVFLHCFLDGRDVAPKSALDYVRQAEAAINKIGLGKIATVSGRYYAMDRDKHWERIELSYNSMVLGKGVKAPNAYAAIQRNYDVRITDEFIEPAVIIDEKEQPVATINDGDSIIFFNFRADRARQITRALTDPDFKGFEREQWPQVNFVCLTQYDAAISVPVAFAPQNLDKTLGEVLSRKHLYQLRIAETEKYAHVTFFFNGGVEKPSPGEDRILIPSPDVSTYNLKPEMSAKGITERVLAELDRDYYDVIIMNYANPDMVGHTGIYEAAVQAVKVVDQCLIKVVEAVLERAGTIIITADHGNCEMMSCPENGGPYTAHTTKPVPFILVSERYKEGELYGEGALEDIAPTILEILGIDVPEEMTGRSLIIN